MQRAGAAPRGLAALLPAWVLEAEEAEEAAEAAEEGEVAWQGVARPSPRGDMPPSRSRRLQ